VRHVTKKCRRSHTLTG